MNLKPIVALTLGLLFSPVQGLHGQDPKLAPDNLEFTRSVAENNHLIADVSMQVEEDQFVRFRYDRYPDVKQITTEDGTAYAQRKGKGWLKSADWGKTGEPVKPDWEDRMEMLSQVAESPLGKSTPRDNSQGKTVWKLVSQKKEDGFERFTFEQTRENPRPNGVYPRYTFLKGKKDKEGELLLEHFSAQMRSGEKLIPVEIHLGIMIVLPEGSVKIERVDVPGKSEKQCK
ncbi:hypothetical protein [Prosthecobacter sp.]|uniref:hypothetical protein n=1 Tax=Prosthecobacter sp. TaxID=1965333 RepID=UPI003784EA7C